MGIFCTLTSGTSFLIYRSCPPAATLIGIGKTKFLSREHAVRHRHRLHPGKLISETSDDTKPYSMCVDFGRHNLVNLSEPKHLELSKYGLGVVLYFKHLASYLILASPFLLLHFLAPY